MSRRRKCEVRDKQQILDCPGIGLILQEQEIRRPVALNCVHHGSVCAIVDPVADARFTALELIPEFAIRAPEVAGLGVVAQASQPGRRAIGAIEIVLTPRFRDDPRPLRAALVCGGKVGGHGEVHERYSIIELGPIQFHFLT